MSKEADKPKGRPGPKEERLKIEGAWEDAVKKAVQKQKPEEGWPDAEDQQDEPDDDRD